MSNLIVVYQSSFLHEIYLVKHNLEQEGIISFPRNENVMATIGVSNFQQYELMVNERDVEKAIDLINEQKL